MILLFLASCSIHLQFWVQKKIFLNHSDIYYLLMVHAFLLRKFRVVGAQIRKAREPSERLWRGTLSSLAEQERVDHGSMRAVAVDKTSKIRTASTA